ncbi:cytidylyltransferase domain-containing protein [Candidatus Margulisiibacteriota bacterium]
MEDLKILAMIPARMGSTRLQKKNLALVGGQPMISYPIRAAKESGVFDKVIVNSEDVIFKSITDSLGVDFYQRPIQHASSTAKSDAVVYDFLQNNPCDVLVWVNSIAPLQSASEIKAVVESFVSNDFDSLITVKDEQVHCIYDNSPLNYSESELFAQTQDLKPVQCFVYSLMMWKAESFIRQYEEQGHAILCGKVGYYPVSKLSSLIVKKEEDLMIVDYLAAMMNKNKQYIIKYDSVIEDAKQ